MVPAAHFSYLSRAVGLRLPTLTLPLSLHGKQNPQLLHGASGALLVPVPGCGVEASHVDFALVVARKAKSPVAAVPDVPKAELDGRGLDHSTFLDNFNHKNRPFYRFAGIA